MNLNNLFEQHKIEMLLSLKKKKKKGNKIKKKKKKSLSWWWWRDKNFYTSLYEYRNEIGISSPPIYNHKKFLKF